MSLKGNLVVLLGVFVAFGLFKALQGTGTPFHLAAASPMRDVLVYAKPAGPCCKSTTTQKQIWVAAANGGHPRILTDGTDPTVSPDGRYVAYDSDKNVLVVPTSGGAATTIASGAYPGWAPNSRFLAYYGAAGLVVVDVRTGKQATAVPRDGKEWPDGFAFSPDSQRIAYTLHSDLYVGPTTGGSPIRVTDDHKSVAPVWGKPGIVFNRFADKAHADIWLSDGTKDDVRQLTHTGANIWPAFFSASGTELLAANPAMHNGRLWAVDMATGDERPLTASVGDLVPQGLSADGSTVLAAVGCGGTVSRYGYVETIPFAGGKPHVIVRGPCRASWNAR